ncbi:MAG: histidine phosphatase family protein [Selenomonas sp.]|nr:histidine phosphatase family protein [Selenomonas sp.]
MAIFACVFMLFPALAKAQGDVTHVILVRHGQTDYNLEGRWQGFLDIPLNATGIRQAELLAESLRDVPIDVFISSPLKRALVTTEKCARLHGKEIAYTDDRLKEINYGEWAGMKREDVAKKYTELNKLWEERPWLVKIPKGESLRELGNRYREALEDAARKYPGKTIFIGAHSLGNMALICNALDISLVHF